jgi:hypothetical protein
MVCVFIGTSTLAASALVTRVEVRPGTAAALLLDVATGAPSHQAGHLDGGPNDGSPASPDRGPADTSTVAERPRVEEVPALEEAPPKNAVPDQPAARPVQGGQPQTSCQAVVHVGDSTSLGLTDPSVLTRVAQIPARYRSVGVADVTTDILGARSIVERFEGQPNAEDAVIARVGEGYRGCWVIAMGINEVANQQVGGVVPLGDRIDLVMQHLEDRPVLWTTVRTLTTLGPYAGSGMGAWNEALREACQRHPTMRVYDWAAEVQAGWFSTDGIHYTAQGYAQRAQRLADALARAFPEGMAAGGECVVTSS